MRPALALLLAGMAVAHTAYATAPRSLRMLYVEAPAEAPASLFLVAGKEIVEIDLPRLAVSTKRLSLPAGAVRVRVGIKAPTKAEPLPEDAPFVDIPAEMKEPLVVLLPSGQAGPLAFHLLPLEFSRTRVPEGGIVWFNLSTRTLSTQLGQTSATIPPRQAALQIPSGKVGDPYPVLVDLAADQAQADRIPLLRSTWVKEPGQRRLLFCLPDPRRKSPRLVVIPDRLERMPTGEKDATSGDGKARPTASGKPG